MIKNTILVMATCCVMLVLVEVGLRMATPFPITEESNKKPHPDLVYTLDPAFPDVDASGFRNSRWTLDQADLAVIGDSHTYGVNVDAEQSFPSVLEAKTGRKVYNLGVSSYGIYQYHVLVEEAIEHGVEDIVIGLYPANDLALNCEVLATGYWQAYARENDLALPDCKAASDASSSPLGALKSFLARTATFQIAREFIWLPAVDGDDPSAGDYFLFDRDQAVSKERVRGHSRVASLDDPDVEANFENSKKLFLDDRAAARDASIGFSVTIVPSKERVLHAWLERRHVAIDETFAGMMESELSLVQAYTSFFEANDIAHGDALPDVLDAFERVLEAGGEFYPRGNGHPLADGYSAYAEAAIRGMEQSREGVQVTNAD